MWMERYEKCGCTTEAARKKDLVGYCADHGNEVAERIKLPSLKPSMLQISSEAEIRRLLLSPD